MFIEHSLLLTILPTLVPLRLMLTDTPSPHGSDASLSTVGSIVRGLWTGRYLPAVPRRVLVMEHQVLS